MPIALFGASADSNTLVQVDDTTVWTDEGSSMPTPYMVTADVDSGPAGGSARLRAIVQAITIADATSVRVTPIADGVELTDQAETFALVTAEGVEQRIEHMVAAAGTRHAVKLEFTSIAGAVALGESDMVLIRRRSTERA